VGLAALPAMLLPDRAVLVIINTTSINEDRRMVMLVGELRIFIATNL
jgi:hypothetical protein